MDKDMRLDLAYRYMIGKKYPEAEEYLKPLIADAMLDPEDPFSFEVLFVNSFILQNKGLWDLSEILVRNLLGTSILKTKNVEFEHSLQVNLICALVELGKNSEADVEIEKILSQPDESPQNLFQKGHLLGSVKRYEESVDYYKKCLELDRYNVVAYIGLNRSLKVIGKVRFSFLCLHCEHTSKPLVYVDENDERKGEVLQSLSQFYTSKIGLVPNSLRLMPCEECGKKTMFFLHICRMCFSGYTGHMSINHEPNSIKDFYITEMYCNSCFKRFKIDTSDLSELKFMSTIASVTPKHSESSSIETPEKNSQNSEPSDTLWYDDDEWQEKMNERKKPQQYYSYDGKGKWSSHSRDGHSLLRKGEVAKAEVALRKSISEDNQYSLSWEWLGEALEYQNRYWEAEEAYRKAIECDPLNTSAMSNLFTILLEQKRGQDAIDIGLQIVNVNPRALVIWEALAKVYLALEDKEKSWTSEHRARQLRKGQRSPLDQELVDDVRSKM
jgi:tetratricopeptide (TPR) repeat protein